VNAIPPLETAADGWRLGLDVDRVLRGQGADAARARAGRPRLVALAERALAEGTELLDPRVAFRRLPIAAIRRGRVVLQNGAELAGALPARILSRAWEAAVLAVTIGERLEVRVSELLESDLPRALALDGLGSAAVEALAAAAACRHLEQMAGREGMRTTAPIGPGMTGWPLGAGQTELFGLLGSDSAGVRLMASGAMLPRKTLSMLVGIGPGLERTGRTCDHCGSRDICRDRGPDAAAPG
jgi:hypothetical protein